MVRIIATVDLPSTGLLLYRMVSGDVSRSAGCCRNAAGTDLYLLVSVSHLEELCFWLFLTVSALQGLLYPKKLFLISDSPEDNTLAHALVRQRQFLDMGSWLRSSSGSHAYHRCNA